MQEEPTILDEDVPDDVDRDDDNFLPETTLEPYDPRLDLSTYKFPSLELLDNHQSPEANVSNEELISNKNRIVEALRNFKIEIVKIRATIGPTITLYEIVPAPGIRISKIKSLEDDIALSLAALGIRIIAPMPGQGTIGIEVPNSHPQIVSMRSIIASKKFQEDEKSELPIVLGKTISNETFLLDLAKMPHILVAGATGQGKSVGLNALITSLLYKKHPAELKFVMVDPKKVELSLYSVIEKHFLAKLPDEEEPIVTDVDKVKNTLNSLCVEMDHRYDLLKKAHVRNVKEYNGKFIARRLNPEKGHHYMPYIVVIIDEFADLIMQAGKEIELPIARIAQLARAVGIHMVIATQRPSVNVITGVIKANFPARIAFKVAQGIDSKTILDQSGAHQLIGKGDMLVSQSNTITRLQCALVETPEIERICAFIADQQGYMDAFLLPEYVPDGDGGLSDVDMQNIDAMFDQCARLVVATQQGSTSMIQRKFSIGYNRAGRIMDQMEKAGIVGPSEGGKPRQVLLQDEYSLEQLLNRLH
jgi:S-DNA-T family DNA segregation ATPase FtsK/SpoIIIE